MLMRILITFFLLLGPAVLMSEEKDAPRFSDETMTHFIKIKKKADIKLQSKNLVLAVFVYKTADGDGYHGILYEQGGNEIEGKEEALDFQTYKLAYYGKYTERSFDNSRSGWLPQNLNILKSRHASDEGKKGITLENEY